MIDQAEAKRARNRFLQLLDIFIGEFDDFTRLDIDQMIVMIVRNFLIPGTPITEIMAREDGRLFKQAAEAEPARARHAETAGRDVAAVAGRDVAAEPGGNAAA